VLRARTARFTFNRLSQVGGGRDFNLPDRDGYAAFLRQYLAECRRNPVLGLKDNLLNLVRWQRGGRPAGGCTGFGCGAAFNFVALLPDGEVHACRKFPSLLGDIREQSLADIYQSAAAKRYRQGPAGCRGCPLRRRCGGCLAVTHGAGLDPLQDRDPMCFLPGKPGTYSI
jgi:selenobiotic family peptide radical SAM maturase